MTSPEKRTWKALYEKELFKRTALTVAKEMEEKRNISPSVALSKIFDSASEDAECLLHLEEEKLKELLRSFF